MFTEDQEGVLGELINIAFGKATSLIADLFDSFATLRIPQIEVIPIEVVNEVVKDGVSDSKIYVSTQHIKGSFSGDIVLALDEESARNMQHIIGEEDEEEDKTSMLQNILEIANILGTSCMGKFAELLDTEISFTPPSIDYSDYIIRDVKDSPYSKVLVISTLLEFQDLDIKGNVLFMFNDEMYSKLAKALDDFVENI